MAYLKKLFCCMFIFAASAVHLCAQTPVNNENALRNALNNSSGSDIVLSGSFNFFNDLGSFTGKDAKVMFSTLTAVTISGDNLFKGFEFLNSVFTLTGSSTSTFTSFYSALSSGAVINTSGGSYVSVSSVTFSSNTALSGGAFFIINSTGELSGIFAGTNTASGHGGFMFADQSSFTVVQSTVFNNSASYGGGLSISTSAFAFNNVYFASNTALSSGGALYVENGNAFSVVNSTFTGNNAVDGGAAYLLFASFGIMNNIDAANNTADKGAGFYFDNSRGININNSRFVFNDSAQSGGAFYIFESTAINMTNVRFSSNSAGLNGGAVFAEKSEISIISSYADNNTADFGGVLYLLGGNAVIEDAIFENNGAQSSGGALYILSSSAILNNAAFSENSASASGGAMYIEDANMTVQYLRFNGNTAGTSGGAIFIKDSSAVLNGISFSGNYAQNGGAVYMDQSKVTVNGGTFTNNSASGAGGAFYVSGGSELILNASSAEIKFEANSDPSGTNDIYLEDNSKLTLNAQNHDILLGGSIAHGASFSNIEITKTGARDLYLGGNNIIECDLNIVQGGLIVSEAASLTMNNLTVNSGNTFSAARNSSVNIINALEIKAGGNLNVENNASFNAGTLDMYGDLSVGVDLKTGASGKITAGIVNLDPVSSKFLLDGNLERGNGVFTIIDASSINGDFNSYDGNYGVRTTWSMSKSSGNIDLFVEAIGYDEITGLTYNQQQTANMLNDEYDAIFVKNGGLWKNVVSPMDAMNIDDLQQTLELLSGSFYADLFKAAAVNSRKNNMFGHIREKSIADENSWAQIYGSLAIFKKDDYAANDFENINCGIQAGWDLKNEDGLIGGIMIGYNNHDIKRADETAGINALEAGAYGALCKNSFELKGILSLGYQAYETERKSKALNTKTARDNFSGYTASFDAHAGYGARLSQKIVLKPFFEFGAAVSINDKVEEDNADLGLKIDPQNYFYSDAQAGIGFNGYHKKIQWYINGGAGYTITGLQNEIETGFIQADGKMKVKGCQQGEMFINAVCGIEITVFEQFYVYANGGHKSADGYENIYANAGLRYRLR